MRFTFHAGLLAAASVMLSVPAFGQQAVPKIVYVNPQSLFENAPGRAQAEAALEREGQGFRQELDRLTAALNQAVADYQRAEPTLTAAQKETRQRGLSAKQDSLRQRQQDFQEQFSQRQNELMAPIMEAVRKVLEDIRVEDGYTMILNNDPQNSIILAADRNLDITERVVARLRTLPAARPAPATAAPAAAPGAPASAPSGVTRPRPPV